MMAEHRKGVADGACRRHRLRMLAAYYSAVARGLAVQARDGARARSWPRSVVRHEPVAGRKSGRSTRTAPDEFDVSRDDIALTLHHLESLFETEDRRGTT